MRTSVLSRDWKHKWTSIYAVDITFSYSQDYKPRDADFYSFVDRVLDSNPDLNLRTFRLKLLGGHKSSSGDHESHHLERWVSKVLNRGVQELTVNGYRSRGNFVLERPTSLTSLHLCSGCTLIIRNENCFSKLKDLNLWGKEPIKIVNEQSPNTGELSVTFPALKKLELNFIQFKAVVTINAPILTSFKIISSYTTENVIKIFAPKLREFKSVGAKPDIIVLHTPSLYFAAVEGYSTFPNTKLIASRTSAILQGVPSLKCLQISCLYMKALAEWEEDYGFPTFDRLIRLTVRGNKADGLMELLQATPNLKSLTIDVSAYVPKILQEPLPLCIVSRLKRVHLRDYSGEGFQNDMAIFFLENAKMLQRLYLYPYSIDLKKAEKNSWISKLGLENSSRIKVVRKRSSSNQ